MRIGKWMMAGGVLLVLGGCGAMRTADEMRTDPAGTYAFSTTKDWRATADIIGARLQECYGGSTYSPGGMRTSDRVVERQIDEAARKAVVSDVLYGALGPMAVISAVVTGTDSGADVTMYHGTKAMRARTMVAEQWVNDGWTKCKPPKD